MVVQHLVLHADRDLHKDVVVRLGFDDELRLLHLQVHKEDALGIRNQQVQAGPHNAVELAEALHHASLRGADGV